MGVIKRQGIKNAVFTYLGIAIGAVNIVFIQPRLLSPDELGLTRLLFDITVILALIAPMGTPGIVAKYFPYYKERETGHQGFLGVVTSIFVMGCILSCAALWLLKPVIASFYQDRSGLFVRYFNYLIPFMLAVSAVNLLTTYCHSLFKSTVPTFLNDICIRLGLAVITFAYFFHVLTLEGYLAAYIGLYAVMFAVMAVYIVMVDKVRFVPTKDLLSRARMGELVRFGILMGIAAVASLSIRKVDGILLAGASLKLIGVYTTAVFIASFIEVPLGALERISHTKISEGFSRNKIADIGRIYTESVRYLLATGGLLYCGIIACTRHLYDFGGLPDSFVMCVDVVYIVGFGSLVNIATGVNSAIIFYSEHYKTGIVILVFTLTVTVASNLLLIPRFGIYGAAFSSCIGVLFFNGLKFIFIYKRFHLQPYNRQSISIVVVIAGMSLVAALLPDAPTPLASLLYKGSVVTAAYVLIMHRLALVPELSSMMVTASRRLRGKRGQSSSDS